MTKVKPERWWMEWHPHFGFIANVGLTRAAVQSELGPGSKFVRVEIRVPKKRNAKIGALRRKLRKELAR